MDISREMLVQASRSASDAGSKNTSCIQADLESVAIKDGSVDAVICVGVLQYLQDDKKGIMELARILKPGGLAVVTLPNMLRINNFMDPYYYLRGIKYFAHRISRKLSKRNAASEPSDFSTNRMFSNRRYISGSLQGDFLQSRLRSVEMRSVGFGPLTFWQEPFLPEAFSLSLSDKLERVSEKAGFTWLRFFSNRWVISLRKVA
jgi:ubiquinone/menaquinone biosynthesis C-methylase UbiE